tara:strand:+ start:365 stop:787 length:423 start_codon:yes stop_codon:yes gene_type:complete
MDKVFLFILLLTSPLISSQEFDGFSIIKTKENVTINYIDVTRDVLYQSTENGLDIVYTPKGVLELTNKEYKTFIKDVKKVAKYKIEVLYEAGEKYGKIKSKEIIREKYIMDSYSYITYAIYFTNLKGATCEIKLEDIEKL